MLGPSPVPPIYLTGSFGLVPPAWINYTRSAVPRVIAGWTGGGTDRPTAATWPRRPAGSIPVPRPAADAADGTIARLHFAL